jgi:acetyl esterase/lipase
MAQPTTDAGFVAFHGEMLRRGYTVVAVRTGSQPRYTVPDMAEHVQRAVRFIRHRSADWGTDPDRIGIAGVSSGGYLAVYAGVAGDDGQAGKDGRLVDADPVERRSSRVAAVAAYVPPTDFLGYGFTRDNAPRDLRAAFDFRRFDQDKGVYVPIRDETEFRTELGRLSPARRVTKAAAPTLIIQGERDPDVPLAHSERMVARLRESGVPAELLVRKGAGHAWKDERDPPAVADWFDRHLGKPEPGKR